MAIPIDKVLHFIVGFCISAVLGIWLPLLIVLLIVFIVGVLKEVWDAKHNGDVEAADVVATVTGGLVGVLLHL
jgi:uncharacterized protein YqgC (DUF456 family)